MEIRPPQKKEIDGDVDWALSIDRAGLLDSFGPPSYKLPRFDFFFLISFFEVLGKVITTHANYFAENDKKSIIF